MKTYKNNVQQKLLLCLSSLAFLSIAALFSASPLSAAEAAEQSSSALLASGLESDAPVGIESEVMALETEPTMQTATPLTGRQLANAAGGMALEGTRTLAKGSRQILRHAAEIAKIQKELAATKENPEVTRMLTEQLSLLLGEQEGEAKKLAKDLEAIHNIIEDLGIGEGASRVADKAIEELNTPIDPNTTSTIDEVIKKIDNTERTIDRKARTFPQTSASLTSATKTLRAFTAALKLAQENITRNPSSVNDEIPVIQVKLQQILNDNNINRQIIGGGITYYFPDKKQAKRMLGALITWLEGDKIESALQALAKEVTAKKTRLGLTMPPTPQEIMKSPVQRIPQ